jgi:adenylyl-sulfate kinase
MNIFQHETIVSQSQRSILKKQTPKCLWLTGLSGSGKSTIANSVERKLVSRGRHTYLIDADNIRLGLNKDLGFSLGDRAENIRRIAEVAKLFLDAGLIVIVCAISPIREERAMARGLIKANDFLEVYVDTSLAICELRDVKGLYAKARAGEIQSFTGIDSPYEAPLEPDIHLRTEEKSAEECAELILKQLV